MTRPALLLSGVLAVASVVPAAAGAFTVTSSAFADGASIPSPFTCEGADLSPPLAWQSPPQGTRSLALIVDDPDAPDPAAPRATPWVHWVLYNLPADSAQLPEGVQADALPAGTHVGVSDGSRPGYHGPCPPIGRHRYRFTLYALDVVLSDVGRATSERLSQAMQGHVLGTAVLTGTYQKAATSHAP